jgi:hypothetical protein
VRWGPARWGLYRWQPLDLWKTSGFWRQLAALGAVMAMLSLAVPSASASLIYSLSGGYNEATAISNLTLTEGSAVNDPAGIITSGTYSDLTLDLSSSSTAINVISGITIPAVPSLTITTGADTVTFGFGEAMATVYTLPLGFTTLFYGIVQAPISSVTVVGSDAFASTLTADLSPFSTDGGYLVLTYNGIDLTSGGATIPVAPSSSFTLLANAAEAPEPSTAILSLAGAMAIGLGKLARQLRRKNSIALDESPAL